MKLLACLLAALIVVAGTPSKPRTVDGDPWKADRFGTVSAV